RRFRARRRRGPTCRLEESKSARLARCRRARRPKQARVSRVSASARGDLVSDLPGVFQCGGEYAAGALAQSIIATAAIERADARLEAHTAAIASGPMSRASRSILWVGIRSLRRGRTGLRESTSTAPRAAGSG